MMNKDKELQERYGHLMDKYLHPVELEREIKEQYQEEGKTRYGDLLQKGEAAYNKHFNDLMRAADVAKELRLKEEAKEKQAAERTRERMEKNGRKNRNGLRKHQLTQKVCWHRKKNVKKRRQTGSEKNVRKQKGGKDIWTVCRCW